MIDVYAEYVCVLCLYNYQELLINNVAYMCIQMH